MKFGEQLYLAKNFRKNMTKAEKIFWEAIRKGSFQKLKFKRQYIIENFIVDFYCHKYKLAIEIDGKIHEKQKEKDIIREELIKKKGMNILRFKNEEVENNIDNVLKQMNNFINKQTSPSPEAERGPGGEDRERAYCHAFNLIPQFGPQRIKKLLDYFPNLETAWQADFFNLLKSGLEKKIIYTFIEQRKKIDPEKEWPKIPANIAVVTQFDEQYPESLKQTHSAPFILYVDGDVNILTKQCIAVVGSRNMSDYGKRVCDDLVEQLTRMGLTIVSGLADGIDTIAHETCLNNKGKTIAVLGCGVNNNVIFPAQNRHLAKQISTNGAVISEYPPQMKAQRNFFPARNRIISGLSLGTLIIEAAKKSGALITAYKALEQNREVFAVPGSIYNSRSVGCNNLIKKGAKLVQNIEDIIEELPINIEHNERNYKSDYLNNNEKQILKHLSLEPIAVDNILKSCRLNKSQILSSLTNLELKGIIKNINNNYYICQRN